MSYCFPRGGTIMLAWQVVTGDPSLVSTATAALRPALAIDPSKVDPQQSAVATFGVTFQPANVGAGVPAFWLLTLAAGTSAGLSLGDYIVDLRLVFSDGAVAIQPGCRLSIYEPATTA